MTLEVDCNSIKEVISIMACKIDHLIQNEDYKHNIAVLLIVSIDK